MSENKDTNEIAASSSSKMLNTTDDGDKAKVTGDCCTGTKITDLNNDTLLHIMSMLNSADLISLSFTCKQMDQLARDSSLWAKADFRSIKMNKAKLIIAYEFLNEKTTELEMIGSQGQNKLKLNTMDMLYINLICPKIIHFYFENIDIDFSLPSLPGYLQKLSLISVEVPSRKFLANLGTYLPYLQSLNLSNNEWVTNHALLAMSKCPNLRELIIVGCKLMGGCIAYTSLAAKYGFAALEILDARDTCFVDTDAAEFVATPNLCEIYLGRFIPDILQPLKLKDLSECVQAVPKKTNLFYKILFRCVVSDKKLDIDILNVIALSISGTPISKMMPFLDSVNSERSQMIIRSMNELYKNYEEIRPNLDVFFQESIYGYEINNEARELAIDFILRFNDWEKGVEKALSDYDASVIDNLNGISNSAEICTVVKMASDDASSSLVSIPEMNLENRFTLLEQMRKRVHDGNSSEEEPAQKKVATEEVRKTLYNFDAPSVRNYPDKKLNYYPPSCVFIQLSHDADMAQMLTDDTPPNHIRVIDHFVGREVPFEAAIQGKFCNSIKPDSKLRIISLYGTGVDDKFFLYLHHKSLNYLKRLDIRRTAASLESVQKFKAYRPNVEVLF